jgi:hypothetical protein
MKTAEGALMLNNAGFKLDRYQVQELLGMDVEAYTVMNVEDLEGIAAIASAVGA